MAQRRLYLTLLALGLGLAPSPVRAAPVDDLMAAALEALQAGELGEVAKFVKRIDRVVPDTEKPVMAHTLALLRYYEGIAEWKGEDADEAMDSFRACLALEGGFQWDTENFPIEDAESVFEGLRREVASKPAVDLGIPASTGASTLFVAGRRAEPSMRLPEGRYLVQAVCPDGVTYGKWWKYGKAPNYESFCPGGFGETPEPVADAHGSDVLFDEFGNPVVGGGDADLFGPPIDTAVPGATDAPEPPPAVVEPTKPPPAVVEPTKPPPAVVEPTKPPPAVVEPTKPPPAVVEPTEPEKPDEPTEPVEPDKPVEPDEPDEPVVATVSPPVVTDPPPGDGTLPGSARAGFSLDPKGVALMGGGAGFLAAGTVMYFAWVVPNFDAVEDANANGADYTRHQAAGITQSAQVARWTTLGALAVGIAGTTSGALVQFTGLTVSPWGVGLTGEF